LPDLTDGVSEPLRLAKGTKKQLNTELLRLDLENFLGNAADVVFVVVSKDDAGGYLESARRPSQVIGDFTLDDLLKGNVYYVDRGQVSESQIGLKMSNKRTKTEGGVITLRIQTFKLDVLVVNNTGLTLASGTSALITPHNLTFTTNAPEQGLNIRYSSTVDFNGIWNNTIILSGQ
jgi:chondroitin sulfate proteoglycan 4